MSFKVLKRVRTVITCKYCLSRKPKKINWQTTSEAIVYKVNTKKSTFPKY